MSSVHGSSLTFGLFGFSQYILDQNELQYLRLQLWFLPESRRPACSLFWSGQPPLWMFDGSWSPFSGSYPPGHLATLPPGHSRSPGNLPLLFLNKVTAQRLGVNSVESGTKESPAISISNTNQHRSAIAIFSRNLLLYQGNVGPSWVPSTFLSSIKVNTTRNRPGKGQRSDETRQSRRRLM